MYCPGSLKSVAASTATPRVQLASAGTLAVETNRIRSRSTWFRQQRCYNYTLYYRLTLLSPFSDYMFKSCILVQSQLITFKRAEK